MYPASTPASWTGGWEWSGPSRSNEAVRQGYDQYGTGCLRYYEQANYGILPRCAPPEGTDACVLTTSTRNWACPLLAVVAAAGCSAPGGGVSAEPSAAGSVVSAAADVPADSQPLGTGSLLMPVGSALTVAEPSPPDSFVVIFELLHETERIAQQGIDSAVNKCLEPLGFTYKSNPPADGGAVTSLNIWDIPNQEAGLSDGYLNTLLAPIGPVPDEPALGAAYEAALYGKVVGEWNADPDAPVYAGSPAGGEIYDGCLPRAQLGILGGGDPSRAARLVDLFNLLEDVRRDAVRAVFASSEWIDAEARWSQCMSESGLTYSLFVAPASQTWPEPRPSAMERAVATADWACKQRVGVPELGARLLDAAFERIVEESASTFDEVRQDLEDIARRALAAI